MTALTHLPNVDGRRQTSSRHWKQFVADDAVDHGVNVALPEAVDRHECYMRSPYPGRVKVRPERHYQQHRKAADALDD